MDDTNNLIKRYQQCVYKIWALFPSDPLPEGDPAHFLIERLESILDRDLLAPKVAPRRMNECVFGDGSGVMAYMSPDEITRARRLNDLLAPLRDSDDQTT